MCRDVHYRKSNKKAFIILYSNARTFINKIQTFTNVHKKINAITHYRVMAFILFAFVHFMMSGFDYKPKFVDHIPAPWTVRVF